MRFLSVFFVTLALGVCAFSAQKYNYKKYWFREDLESKNANFSFFTKNSPVQGLNGIATMTLSADQLDSADSILKHLKKSLGPQKWTTDKVDGIEIYEKFDVSSMTLFRLAYNPANKRYSLGTVKTRYLMPSYLELHLLQVEGLTNAKSKTSAQLIFELLFHTASAAGFSLGSSTDLVNNYGQLITGLNNTTQAVQSGTSAINGASVQLGRAADSVGSAANAGVKLSNSIDQTGLRVDQFRNSMDTDTDKLTSSLNRNTDNATSAIDRNTDKVTGTVDRNVGKVTDSLDRNTDKIANTVSAKNVAILASVGALSAAVTTSLYSFVASGTYKLARTLYYEAVGEFTPEDAADRIDKFEAAMKNYKDLSPKIESIEQKLTLSSAMFNALSRGNTTEEVLASLDRDIDDQKRKATEAASGCTQCMNQESLLKVQQLESMRDVIKAAGVDPVKKRGEICNDVAKTAIDWKNTDYTLSLARAEIIRDARVYMGLVDKNSDVIMDTNFQEQRKQNNACRGNLDSKLSSISADDIDKCGKELNSPRAVCVTLDALKQKAINCDRLSKSQAGEELKAQVVKGAANFNEGLADLSAQLSQLDCNARDKSGACIEAGVFEQVSSSFKNQFADFAKQCGNTNFAKTLPADFWASSTAQHAAKSVLDSATEKAVVSSPQPESKPSQAPQVSQAEQPTLWSRIKGWFGGGSQKTKVDVTAQANDTGYGFITGGG